MNKNDSINIWIDEPHHILYVVWENHSTSQQYKESWENALLLAQEKKVKRWLIDQREAGTIAPSDLIWATENWYPRALNVLGEEAKVAIIPSKSAFGELATQKAIEKMNTHRDTPMLLRYFIDNDDAVEWLTE